MTSDDPLAPAPINPPAPSVLAAERAIVGAMLTNKAAVDAASQHLTAADFYDIELQTIAQTCIDLNGAGRPIDLVSVQHYLTETKQLKLLNRSGLGLLGRLIADDACLPVPDVIAHHAETVANDALRRRIHDAATYARQVTNDPGFEPEHIQLITDRFDTAAKPTAGGHDTGAALWLADDFDEFLADLNVRDADDRVLTPWADFNEKVALRPGQFVVIGGRPGDGKSLAGLQIAANAAINHGTGALVASLEMRRWELMRRLIAAEAKVELDHLESKSLDERDWQRINAVADKVRAAPLAIDSPGEVSIAHLRSRLRHLGKHRPLGVLVVDYLQLLKVTKKAERRDLDIAEFTRELKQIAIEHNVLVIALSQLNRGPAGRPEKRPVMSDLRESGSIEADADTVILLHRPTEGEEGPFVGEVELIIPKQRAGQSNVVVRLAFQGHYARLFSMRQD